ncbi:hypothetical protein [Flexivirga alba]|uniref:Uncharacterized protein n=1 Tax=Flexivirga alba TaxID=702742 RepID=A0ABW2AJP8_9MICO
MNGTTWIWIIIAIIVILIIVGIVVTWARKRRLDMNRSQAAELRDDSAEHNLALREHEASAARAAAEARAGQADADQRAAQAEQLKVEADRQDEDRKVARHEHHEQLRKADALDPDTRTDREGYQLDANGNRISPDEPGGTATGHTDDATAADERNTRRDS